MPFDVNICRKPIKNDCENYALIETFDTYKEALDFSNFYLASYKKKPFKVSILIIDTDNYRTWKMHK